MKAFPKDVTVQTMDTRHIGVENELGINGEYTRGSETIMQTIEREISKRGLLQSIGHDGGGREFRTNPISVRSLKQVRGYRYVSEYYSVLKDNTRVLETGGTHIHISILNSDHANMEANATALAIVFYEQFQKISGRRSSWARKSPYTTMSEVKRNLERLRRRDGERTYRMKGSMLNPTYHQTLEFRGPKGSNDSEEILAWVEFLDNVVKVANRDSIEGVSFKRLLRGKRISSYIKSLTGWRQLTDADLNKKFQRQLTTVR